MENPFVKLVREGEPSFEDKKVTGIGREIKDGVFTWWEKYDDSSRGPDNQDFSVNSSSRESVSRRIRELLNEHNLSGAE